MFFDLPLEQLLDYRPPRTDSRPISMISGRRPNAGRKRCAPSPALMPGLSQSRSG